MEKTKQALAGLIGLPLGETFDDAAVAAAVDAKTTRLAALEQTGRSLRAALALAGDAPEEALLAAVKGHADAATALKSRVDALALAAETRDRAELVRRGLAEGKLTNAILATDYFRGLDSVALGEYLKAVPAGCAVPLGQLPLGGENRREESCVLTAEEKAVARKMGISDDEMLKTKQEGK